MKKGKSTSISVFKAKALRMIDQVARTGEKLVVEKHGRPIVEVVPLESARKPIAGRLRGTVIAERDILSPLGARLWSASKD